MKRSGAVALAKLLSPKTMLPAYVLLFVTSRCHGSCSHCFYWPRLNRQECELSLSEFEVLARSLGALVQLTITGGSAELREDLPEIVATFVQNCHPFNITLCSNGNDPQVLFRHVSSILQREPALALTVDISLDALGAEHDRLRGLPGLFRRVLQSYSALSSLKARHPGLRLGCGLCVTELNRNVALETARWAMANLPIDNLTPILVRGRTRDPRVAVQSADEFVAIAEEVERRIGLELTGYSAFKTLVNAKDVVQKQLIARIFHEGKSPVQCSAARQTAVIYPDGSVPGCELRCELIGHLREAGMDFGRIWRSDRALGFRRAIREEHCACWHQCFLSAAIVRSPRMWPALITAATRLRLRTATANFGMPKAQRNQL